MTDLPPPPPLNLTPPPGYVAYGGGGAAGGYFRRTKSLAKWLVALLAIGLVVQVALLFVQVTLKDSARDFIEDNLTAAQFDDKIAVFIGIGVLASIAGIAQIVIMIVWAFRLAKNHQVLNRQPQSFSPGATIAVNILGGCTLGILNYFMWREMWKASDPETAAGDPSWKQRLVTPLLTAYLVLSLGGIVASVASGVRQIGGVRTSTKASDVAKDLADQLAVVSLGGCSPPLLRPCSLFSCDNFRLVT
jgi:fluoride ion exporter CrcB/FEX